jgi:hypothetical protein
MNTETLRRLREKLESRRTRMLEADLSTFYPQLKRLWAFLHADTLIKGAIVPIQQRKLHVNHLVTQVTYNRPPVADMYAESDLDHAAVAYNILAEAVRVELLYQNVLSSFSVEGSPLSTIKDRLIQPLFDYLAEALDEQQVVLGHLLRYAQRCEWFDRQQLHTAAAGHRNEAKGQGKRSQVEALLKTGLYRYLHDQGIDFVIEPYSDRGEIDLITDQRGPAPKYIEVKVFDNQDKDKAYLQAGFHQLVTYLDQYKAPVGYLAVYKLCQERLEFERDGEVQMVPFITHYGKTVFLVVIDLYPHDKPVSQRGGLRAIRVTKAELVREVGA